MAASTYRLVSRLRKLYTTLVSDIMDEMDLQGYVVDLSIRPLFPYAKIAGEVVTAQAVKYDQYTKKEFIDWARVMLEFLTVGGPLKVYMIHSEGSNSIATWGEIMSKTALKMGSRGAITDGALRDTPRILKLRPKFQVFARNITPLDAKGRLEYVEYNVPITCGGVNANPGDLVLADHDGVVVLPRKRAEEIIRNCERRYSIETKVGNMVKGKASVFDAVEKYGIF
jgi:4-hydroxy-4-methyl-2-oxoglutarate aldolase